MLIGLVVLAVGFLLNILETWYFGWNMEATSVAEKFADNFCGIVMMLGAAMFLLAWMVRSPNP